MKIKDIAQIIESQFPKRYAMERDNVGLLVGDENTEVEKVLVCCDVDEYVAKEAIETGADMIISHHPLMFSAISSRTFQTSRAVFFHSLLRRRALSENRVTSRQEG